MQIEEVYQYIHGRLKFGVRPGLQRVEALLEKVKHPEKKLSLIHIAGTNGKGSTIAFLRTILMKMGLKVGTFTSPYIEKFNERISINALPISDKDLITYVKKFQPLVKELDADESLTGITEFELITALAFDYFAALKVDVAIIEVGLGGKLDSTNVIRPDLTGITTIGYDHQEILGNTLPEIASQKAGIIKDNVPLVTGNIVSRALLVIEKCAKKLNAPIFEYKKNYQTKILPRSNDGYEHFSYFSKELSVTDLQSALCGAHQVENAAMAIKLAQIYLDLKKIKIVIPKINPALQQTFWPARMEKINNTPLTILDGAHNPHAVTRLVENLQKNFSNQKVKILFSALKTKDVHTMINKIKVLPNIELFLTTFDYPKALELTDVVDLMDERTTFVADWQQFLPKLYLQMSKQEVLLVTGSLYFTSQVRNFWQKR